MTATEARNTADTFLKREEENFLPRILKEIKLCADIGIKFLELDGNWPRLPYRQEDINKLKDLGFGIEYKNECFYKDEDIHPSKFFRFFSKRINIKVCVVKWD